MTASMPKFENKLSLGNVLIAAQLAAMLFGLGTVYANMQSGLEAATTDRGRLHHQAADQEARLRVLERDVTAGLSRIEAQLRLMRTQEGDR